MLDLPTLALSRKNVLKELGISKSTKVSTYNTDLQLDAATGYSLMTVEGNPIPLLPGNTYTITTDSGSYKGVCKELNGIVYIGNEMFVGGNDSGENYGILYMAMDATTLATMLIDLNAGEKIVVSYKTEVVDPIDPKYIPAMDSVTLVSPSGAKFAVSVDDTGALTATEVTP